MRVGTSERITSPVRRGFRANIPRPFLLRACEMRIFSVPCTTHLGGRKWEGTKDAVLVSRRARHSV